MNETAIALNRFGLGASGDAWPADPRRWLLAQIESPPARERAIGNDSAALLRTAPPADAPSGADAAQERRRQARLAYQHDVQQRLDCAVQSSAPFVERLVHFWSNHLAVSVDKAAVLGLAGHYENEAIRPHVLGRFADLLRSAVSHPAMLLYLDQSRSVGPASLAVARAQRRAAQDPAADPPATMAPIRPRGLNENLAREVLELHTLGVRSGYTQTDVVELARALTGWGLNTDDAQPTFEFHPRQHEPGPRTLLGRRYAAGGQEQAQAMLNDLATAPATAAHLSLRLARHFVADDPPASLVARMADAYLRSGGELSVLYRTLIESPQTWASDSAKFKSPWDWLVSARRGLRGAVALPVSQPPASRRRASRRDRGSAAALLQQLGQPTWKPGLPAGWEDQTATWAAPEALMRRVEIAQRLAAAVGDRVDARLLAPRLLPGGPSPATAQAIERAESPVSALALLLVSPDFLRR